MLIDLNNTVYHMDQCAAFKRSRDKFGKLSNMTGGFPLEVNGITFQSPEGLYQALKFPRQPKLQERIADQRSGMDAKKAAYSPGGRIVPDWDSIRVQAMLYTTTVKLAQHPSAFAHALLEAGHLPIVENSSRDSFWGAVPKGTTLHGSNVLGKILTIARQTLVDSKGDISHTIQQLTSHLPDSTLAVNSIYIKPPVPKEKNVYSSPD